MTFLDTIVIVTFPPKVITGYYSFVGHPLMRFLWPCQNKFGSSISRMLRRVFSLRPNHSKNIKMQNVGYFQLTVRCYENSENRFYNVSLNIENDDYLTTYFLFVSLKFFENQTLNAFTVLNRLE